MHSWRRNLRWKLFVFFKPWFEKLLFFGTSVLIWSFYALEVTALLYSGATIYTVHSSVAMLIEQQSNGSHILTNPHCCWFQKDLGKINSGSVCLQSDTLSVQKSGNTKTERCHHLQINDSHYWLKLSFCAFGRFRNAANIKLVICGLKRCI